MRDRPDAPRGAPLPSPPESDVTAAPCPVCGVPALAYVRCKVRCANCRTIVLSCADA